jgi:5-methylcytosine-specific restriction protein A
VHHIRPFHTHPELELEPSNLITLCESGRRGVHCHLLFGHLGSFRRVNPMVHEDVKRWRAKLSR